MSKTPLYVLIAIASTLFLSAQIDQSQSSSVAYATVQVVKGRSLGIDREIEIAYADGQEEEIDLGESEEKSITLINQALNSVAAKGYQLKYVTQAGERFTVYTFEKNY